jgi:hypothetical protein
MTSYLYFIVHHCKCCFILILSLHALCSLSLALPQNQLLSTLSESSLESDPLSQTKPPLFLGNQEEWKRRSIYQLLTDRFNNPVDQKPCQALNDYCGGTFQGKKFIFFHNINFIYSFPRIQELLINLTIFKIWGSTPFGFHPWLKVSFC